MTITDMGSDRCLLMVHGRDFKPGAEACLDLWLAALRSGIERDFPDALPAFDATGKALAWYGDLTADVLRRRGRRYDEQLDIGDRRNALAALRELPNRKRFGIRQYDNLPGKSALPEFLAGIVAPLAGGLSLDNWLIGKAAPDVGEYFNSATHAEAVRARLLERLCGELEAGRRVALLSHGTGSIVAYDVLWQLSHDAALNERCNGRKVEHWLTLGSPLGDSAVQKRLLGAGEKGQTRFPVNVISWHNVAAEDDFTCHDNTLADDFKRMLQQRLVSAVKDYKIYNLAVRYGKSNPHSSVGYLVHPRVAKILADWLSDSGHVASPKYTL